VPLPPNFKRPKREKGTLNVVISGVTLRITITLDGSPGKRVDDILIVVSRWNGSMLFLNFLAAGQQYLYNQFGMPR
jgi:hypothetical protein